MPCMQAFIRALMTPAHSAVAPAPHRLAVIPTDQRREFHIVRHNRDPARPPYIWATWLPRLLTGEKSCEWTAWFKAHHRNWTRTPSDFNQAQWLIDHTALLNKQRAGGYSPCRSRLATLAVHHLPG